MNKTIEINELIFEKLKFRYDFYVQERIEQQKRNKYLLDTFYPKVLADSIIRKTPTLREHNTLSRTGYAISQRVSDELGCKLLHISELITMLGYTKTEISKILQAVKNKQHSCVLVGLGGTGSNFLHWLYEMAEWTGKDRIFNQVLSYDNDTYDVLNMLRIPFIPEYFISREKPYKAECLPRKFKILAQAWLARSKKLEVSDMMPTRLGVTNKTFIYGAPDINTRTYLSASDFTFFAATHRDGEYSIVENPDVDNDLMMETYGKINLSKFLLNHLSMTIDFLKYIGTREENLTTQRQNVEIVRKDFDQHFGIQLANGFKAGAKKLYVASAERLKIDLNIEEEE